MTANPHIGLIREKIGYALYTLQEFYSNTNWVELKGDTVYEDFGKGFNTGKCSIGTSDDQSKDRCAIGGIYKGRSTKDEAPHYYLHEHAVSTAIRATQYFLLDEGNGIYNLLGRKLFMDVFHLQSKESVVDTSLTFVVDVTGSMGSDIDAVITSLATIVTDSRSLEFIPSKYVLVTFSDPENLTTGRETSDWVEMIGWMRNLTVSGGDDCPEYALSGLLKGIEMSNRNSKIYLCTDASAKDSEKVSDLIHGLTAKSLTPVFLLTGNCDGIGWETIKTLEHFPIINSNCTVLGIGSIAIL
ncbi:von Willebrand factor A domain-containing protein 7-like [Ostrea edulis]|uniref:von Willebrand factor A domain-containing protein 7-like n=1 Tax=Ostrea edulis TaxID=37623 RepID=UPI0024AF2C70|nr:von Willebrand factor A domain-containing protein 7-like [Ostrea edulis]